MGEIRKPRLYQLIRRKGRVEDNVFEIEFLDPGAQVFHSRSAKPGAAANKNGERLTEPGSLPSREQFN